MNDNVPFAVFSVKVDKIELSDKAIVDRGSCEWSWEWLVENRSRVSRFDLAWDVKSSFGLVAKTMRRRIALVVVGYKDTRGYMSRYYGANDAPVRLRVYERDFDALFPTGEIRLEWQLRGKVARAYLEWAAGRLAFTGEVGTMGEVYRALVNKWFKSFPRGIRELEAAAAPSYPPTRDPELGRLVTAERCLNRLQGLKREEYERLVRALAGAWARSGGDEVVVKKDLDRVDHTPLDLFG